MRFSAISALLTTFALIAIAPSVAAGQSGSHSTLTVSGKLSSGPTNNLESYIPATESVSQTKSTVARERTALLGFTKAGDDPEQQASSDTIGLSGYALNNATDLQRTAYAGYLEARRFSGAGTTHGLEIDILAGGSSISDIDPFTPTRVGATIGLHLSAGKPDQAQQGLFTTPVSAALNIITMVRRSVAVSSVGWARYRIRIRASRSRTITA